MSRKLIPALAIAVALITALAAANGASAAISAGNTGWSWANPLPQGNSLSRVEVSGGRVWVGGATGTLLHSDDGGTGWAAVRTGLLDEIRTVDAISPFSVVFAGRCALRRSDDSGLTVRRLAWGSNDDTCAAQIQAIDFTSPLLGYLLLSNGDVYTTGDGGESWKKQSVVPGTKALGGTDAVRDLVFTGSSVGVVSVGNRILQTLDAGVSWTPVKTVSGGPGLMNFEFVSSLVGYAAGDHTDLYKTVDGGGTWTEVSGDGALRAQSVTGLTCSGEQKCIATLAGNGAVLRTSDSGASWEAQNVDARQVSSVAFVTGSRAVAVGQDGLTAMSEDGGATWTSLTNSVRGVFRGIRADSAKVATAFGDAGAVARSIDGGKSWRSLTAASTEDLVDATNSGKHEFALTATGKFIHSSDGGASWAVTDTGVSGRPRGVYAWSGKRLALIGDKGVAIVTAKGAGFSGRRAQGSVASLRLRSADGAGKKATFVFGPKAIALTKDKGRSWLKVGRPRGAGAIVRLDMLDAKFGYLLDANAELFVTKNGGKRWSRIETTGANVAVSMAFGDKRHGYLTDNTGRVLATADGGATWARQYPFYDSTEKSNTLVAANSRLGAIALVPGTSKIFSTTTMGRIGKSSILTIKPSATKVRSGTIVRVTGKLSPATGIEQVTVLARVVGAKGGTKWVSQQRPVSATGTFTSPWKITATTVFIARWSGDASHDGDAAPIRIVKLRK